MSLQSYDPRSDGDIPASPGHHPQVSHIGAGGPGGDQIPGGRPEMRRSRNDGGDRANPDRRPHPAQPLPRQPALPPLHCPRLSHRWRNPRKFPVRARPTIRRRPRRRAGCGPLDPVMGCRSSQWSLPSKYAPDSPPNSPLSTDPLLPHLRPTGRRPPARPARTLPTRRGRPAPRRRHRLLPGGRVSRASRSGGREASRYFTTEEGILPSSR